MSFSLHNSQLWRKQHRLNSSVMSLLVKHSNDEFNSTNFLRYHLLIMIYVTFKKDPSTAMSYIIPFKNNATRYFKKDIKLFSL